LKREKNGEVELLFVGGGGVAFLVPQRLCRRRLGKYDVLLLLSSFDLSFFSIRGCLLTIVVVVVVGPGSRIIGAWRDNYNRTVYICANFKPHDHGVYFTVSAPGAPTNTSFFGFGNYSKEDDGRVVKGKVFWFNKTDDGLQKDHFKLHWRGEGDSEEEADFNNRTFVGTFIKDQRWILVKRLCE